MEFLKFFFPIFVEIMLGNFADTIGVDSWVRQKWEELRQSKYKGLLNLADKNQELAKISREVFDEVLPELAQETEGVTPEIRNAIIEDVLITLTQAHLNSDIFLDHELDTERLTNYLLEPQKLRLQDRPRWQRDIHNRLISFIADHLLTHADQQTDWERTQVRRLLKSINLIGAGVDILVERPDAEARRFEQEYRAYIERKFDKFDYFGIQEVDKRHRQFTILNAFVFPNLHVSNQRHWLTNDEESRREVLEQWIPFTAPRSAFMLSRRILLRGSAGLGKTTLLRWLAVSLAQERLEHGLESLNGERLIPFVIQLRDCKEKGFPSASELVPHISGKNLEPPLRWTTNVLSNHRGWILIDGLDEVPEQQRESILTGIQSLMNAYRDCRFLISSRPDPIKENKWHQLDDLLEEELFTELDIEALQPQHVAELVTKWYEAAAVAGDINRQGELQRLPTALNKQIQSRLVLRRLADTPLLCAMLCLLYSDNQSLPSERIDLFEKCIAMLLSRDEVRKIENNIHIKNDHLRGYLQEIAHWMSWGDGLEKQRAEVCYKIEKLITAYPVSADEVLTYLIERVGLLQAPASDLVAFSHRSFQEFFTAEYLVEEGTLTKKWILDHALNSFWQETIVLAIGLAPRAKVKELIAELLQNANQTPSEADAKSLRLLALASVRMAHAKKDVAELLQTVLDTVKSYFPPRSNEEADALIPADEGAIPLLRREVLPPFELSALRGGDLAIRTVLVACIRALVGIGGESALETLAAYAPLANLNRYVAEELSIAWDAFDRDQFALKVLSNTDTIAIWRNPKDLPLHHLKNIKRLSVWNIDNIRFLAEPWASQLEWLYLADTKISNVNSLASLSSLQFLNLTDTNVSDISALTSLSALQTLLLNNTQVSNVNPLTLLTTLKTLSIADTKLSNISSLASLTSLRILLLEHTQVSDVSALTSLSSLRTLTLSHTFVSNLAPLASLLALEQLDLDNTHVRDIGIVAYLTNLKFLSLNNTQVSNVSALASLTALQSLSLDNTQVNDVSALASLTALQSLSLYNTQVSDVSMLTSLTSLKTLGLNNAQVHGISLLRDSIPNLRVLVME